MSTLQQTPDSSVDAATVPDDPRTETWLKAASVLHHSGMEFGRDVGYDSGWHDGYLAGLAAHSELAQA